MNLLARCYEEGWGVERDPQRARDWYRRSAEAGYFRAQFNIASLLAAEGGWRRRCRWFAPACRRRRPTAPERCAGCRPPSRPTPRRPRGAGRGARAMMLHIPTRAESRAGAALPRGAGRRPLGRRPGHRRRLSRAWPRTTCRSPRRRPKPRPLGELVLRALATSPAFMSAALPLRVYPPLFNRYARAWGSATTSTTPSAPRR